LDNVDLEDNINADDEIANEIKNLHHELVIISEKCEKTHRELLGNARKEMSKQKIKKKIDTIDTEVNLILLWVCPSCLNFIRFFQNISKRSKTSSTS
jgi:hypothetical protein